MKTIKRITMLAALAVSSLLHAQSGPSIVRVAGDCEVYFNFTATGTSANWDNRSRGCNYWVLYVAPSGYSAISLTVQGAQDAGNTPGSFSNWAASTVLLGTFPVVSANASYVQFETYSPWVRINLASATGSGRVQGALFGYRRTYSPVQAVSTGTSSTGLVTATACTQKAAFTISSSGSNQIIAASGATQIRICHISFSATATETVSFVSGTGSNCGTGSATQAGPWEGVQSFAFDYSNLNPLTLPVGTAFCLNQGSAFTAGGVVLYAQY